MHSSIRVFFLTGWEVASFVGFLKFERVDYKRQSTQLLVISVCLLQMKHMLIERTPLKCGRHMDGKSILTVHRLAVTTAVLGPLTSECDIDN